MINDSLIAEEIIGIVSGGTQSHKNNFYISATKQVHLSYLLTYPSTGVKIPPMQTISRIPEKYRPSKTQYGLIFVYDMDTKAVEPRQCRIDPDGNIYQNTSTAEIALWALVNLDYIAK